jgi:peptide chain release factor
MIEWIQLSSGQGPRECERVLWHLLKIFESEAKQFGLHTELLEAEPGNEKKSFRSMLIKIQGTRIDELKTHWQGTLCWRSPSPFRPKHKRQNWFVQSHFLSPLTQENFDLSQVRFEAQRGSGPGGQHVNKSATAIRATYGEFSVLCQEERSQVQNKQLALARIAQLIKNQQEQKLNETKANSRKLHYQLERGNPSRSFSGKL